MAKKKAARPGAAKKKPSQDGGAKPKVSGPRVDPELLKAYKVYCKYKGRLLKQEKKGVVAVGFGLECKNGCYGFEHLPHLPKPKKVKVTYAILVYVKRKLDEKFLKREQMLPTHYEGIPVDVIEMPTCRSGGGLPWDTNLDPLIGGAPIGIHGMNGTLGVIATSPADGSQWLLTCAHVAYGIPPSPAPGAVFQPPAGNLVAVGTPVTNGLNFNVPVDCAAVSLNGVKSAVPGQIISLGQVSGIVVQDPSVVNTSVMKFGVTTGITSGFIVNAYFYFPNGDLGINFDNQYLIASTNPALPFAAAGDSGALVVTQQGNALVAVGILIGLTSSGDAVAAPIDAALAGLGLQL